jgi:DNA-binding CsgD family transcriptional regulator
MAKARGQGSLTARHLAIIGLVARGQTNKAIAAELGVTERAIEAALSRIYEALDVPNRAALIARAMSEAGFGLPMASRLSPPSRVGAVGTPASLEDEARAYELAPFVIAVTKGTDHRYSFINRLAREVTGTSDDRVVGRTMKEVFPDLDHQFRTELDSCYQTGRPWSPGAPVPIRSTGDDGSSREILLNLMFQPLRDGTGSVVGLLHVGAEIGRTQLAEAVA